MNVAPVSSPATSVPSTGSAAGASAPAGGSVNMDLSLPAGLENLMDVMQNFSSAEILLALMLMSALDSNDEPKGGGAAMGFLVGLAMGGQLGQSISFEWSTPGAEIDGGGIGGQLDVTV